jgi:hypothetical protein
MKKFILVPFILLIFLVVPKQSWGDVEQNASLFLWHLINQARVHPKSTIQSLGINEAAARQALGDEQWIIDKGIPPLAWNDKLAQAAVGHGTDMIAHLYYSSTGLDGSTPGDRMRSAGYNPVSEGETLGVLAFSSFVDPMEAVKVVFQNWVRDELNPARQKGRQIFNTEFQEMGGAFIGAVLHLGEDIPPNIYLAVVEFAQPMDPHQYLIGNVYRDLNRNGFMEPNEAVAGAAVVIRGFGLSGDVRVVTGVLGEYQVDLPRSQLILIDVDSDQGPLITGFLAVGGGDRSRLIDLPVP